jgi:SH3 domain protein
VPAAFLLYAVSLQTLPAEDDVVYISDVLHVPLRGGQSPEYRILHRGVKSGTRLLLLEQNSDTNYSLVRMPSGLEGWIPSQYLVSEPIARDQLRNTSDQLLALETKHQKTLLRVQEYDATREELSQSQTSLETENLSLKQELASITALAADVINIDEENRSLRDEQKILQSTIDDLTTMNSSLTDNSNQNWFLLGAGTVLLGLLVGFWVARRIYQKRSNSGWA